MKMPAGNHCVISGGHLPFRERAAREALCCSCPSRSPSRVGRSERSGSILVRSSTNTTDSCRIRSARCRGSRGSIRCARRDGNRLHRDFNIARRRGAIELCAEDRADRNRRRPETPAAVPRTRVPAAMVSRRGRRRARAEARAMTRTAKAGSGMVHAGRRGRPMPVRAGRRKRQRHRRRASKPKRRASVEIRSRCRRLQQTSSS